MKSVPCIVFVGLLSAASAGFASQPAVLAAHPVLPVAEVQQASSSTTPARTHVVTREQVQAELAEARRHGLLTANPNQYPSEYIEHARRQLESLAQQDTDVHERALID